MGDGQAQSLAIFNALAMSAQRSMRADPKCLKVDLTPFQKAQNVAVVLA